MRPIDCRVNEAVADINGTAPCVAVISGHTCNSLRRRLTKLGSAVSCHAQNASRFVSSGRSGLLVGELFSGERDEFCVAFGQLAASDANIVLKSGTYAVRSSSQRPFHHFRLISADAGGGPSRFGELPPQFGEQDIQQMLLCRQGILHAQYELHVWAVIDNAAIDKQTSLSRKRRASSSCWKPTMKSSA